MKKTMHVISIFILCLTMMCTFFFVGATNNVKAVEPDPMSLVDANGVCYSEHSGVNAQKGCNSISNGVRINDAGVITITTTFGYTELLVYARTCDVFGVDGTLTKCNKYGKEYFIHSSGTKESGSSTIDLSKYFDVDDYVEVRVVFKITQDNYNIYSCNKEYNDECTGSELKNLYNRIENLIKANTKNDDNKTGLFSENEANSLITNLTQIMRTAGKKDSLTYMYKSDRIYLLHNTLSSPRWVKVAPNGFDDAKGNLNTLSLGTIKPTLLAVLGLAALVSCVVLGYKIVQCADSPQERSEHISHLKTILISIIIVFVLIAAFEPIVEFFQKIINKSNDGSSGT